MAAWLRYRTWRRFLNLPVLFMTSFIFIVLYLNNGQVSVVRMHVKKLFSERSIKPRWILPVPETSLGHFSLDGLKNWTLFVSSTSRIKNCSVCFHQGNAFEPFLARWEGARDAVVGTPLENSYSRMATAVFALNHGAINIVLTSDVSSIQKSITRLLLDKQPDGAKGIEYYGLNLTIDSFHFHQKAGIHFGNPCLYRIRKQMNPLWTVGIRCRANREPGLSFPTLIDEHAPPVFTPSPKISIVDYNNAFFDYQGLWALFMTFLSSGETASVWGLWAQRLLQEIGAEMALTSLPCPETSMHLTMPKEASTRSQNVFHFVTSWTCPTGKSFYACALTLANDLSSKGHVSSSDIKLLQIWIKELKLSGYSEPKRLPIVPRTHDLILGCVIHSPALTLPSPNLSQDVGPIKLFPNIEPMCTSFPKPNKVKDPFQKYQLKHHNSIKVRDIVLVIIFFDASIYSNIQYLEDMHRHYFSHIVYCGPDANIFISFYKTFKRPLTFIEVADTKGFVAYECVSRAVMMNYDVKGYLEVSDDVILNTWTLGSIPRDKFWFQKDLRIANRKQQMMLDFALPYPFPWWPWTVHGQMWGSKAMAKVWQTFEDIKISKNQRAKAIVNVFLETLRKNSGKPEHFFYCSSDIFYVPARHRQAWSMLSDIFFSNNVFLDIAVPTLMNGMTLTNDIIRMEGTYLWYNDRANYPAYYRSFHQFFHPWKMGWIKRQDHANFLCYYVLPHIVNDIAQSRDEDRKSVR